MNCRSCRTSISSTYEAKIAPFVADRMLDGQQTAMAAECSACGLLFIDVVPTEAQLARYYANYWQEEYIAHRDVHEPGVRERHAHLLSDRGTVNLVESFIAPVTGLPSRVLDLGGGNGAETPFRTQADVHILDVGNATLRPGCSRVDKPQGLYDLVVLAHVLEHVPNPRDLLERAYGACSGYVYLEVPREAGQYG